MKKILIFSNHPAYTYNLRKEVIDGFIDNRYDVTLVVPYGSEIEYFKDIGVKIIDITLKERSTNPFNDLKLLKDNISILRKEKPDVVLTYATKQNIYGGIAARLTNTPYIPMITGLGGAMEKGGLLQTVTSTLYRMGVKGAHTIFAQNKTIHKKMEKFNMIHSPVRLTPGSGVSVERHPFSDYPEKKQSIQFLYIGRIMEDKGIFDLVKATEKIKKDYPEVSFKVIGEAVSKEDLEKIETAEANGFIEYLGRQSDVRPFIRGSHATILPSYHEGMANVLLESASAGRPIITTTVPGCRETFDEGVSGLGFPAKNVQALVEAIETFIKIPYEQKKEMGMAGRKKMEEEFDREIILNMYLKEFNKIWKVS